MRIGKLNFGLLSGTLGLSATTGTHDPGRQKVFDVGKLCIAIAAAGIIGASAFFGTVGTAQASIQDDGVSVTGGIMIDIGDQTNGALKLSNYEGETMINQGTIAGSEFDLEAIAMLKAVGQSPGVVNPSDAWTYETVVMARPLTNPDDGTTDPLYGIYGAEITAMNTMPKSGSYPPMSGSIGDMGETEAMLFASGSSPAMSGSIENGATADDLDWVHNGAVFT